VTFIYAHFGVTIFLARRARAAGPCAAASDKPRFIRGNKVLHSAMFAFHQAEKDKIIWPRIRFIQINLPTRT
jgi:hypothetical protein